MDLDATPEPLAWTGTPPAPGSTRSARPARPVQTPPPPTSAPAGETALPPMVVQRSPTGFVLRDPVLARIVGAPALPLPFTPEADPADVVAHLRRNNPTRTVRFDDALDAPA